MRTRLIVVTAVALATSVTQTNYSALPAPPGAPVSMAASAWSIRYSPGMPTAPSPAAIGWKFDFPKAIAGTCPAAPTQPPNFDRSECHHVDYVTAAYHSPILAKSVTITFSVAGDNPAFDFHTAPGNSCNTPATMRLLLERSYDESLSQIMYRWWSNPISFVLARTGPMTLTVPLTPDQWSDVNGQLGSASSTTVSGFKDTLADIGAVGMSFGGGCFSGHGVYLNSGSATFNVTAFTLN
jgi:hypothetical protein